VSPSRWQRVELADLDLLAHAAESDSDERRLIGEAVTRGIASSARR
jgi:hypothetical protein